MAMHSEPADVPAIRDAFRDAVDAGSMYGVCDLIDALARHPASGPFAELRSVFAEIGYSYARCRAARAMAAVDREFAGTFAVECLWDCEAEIREVGASMAPVTPRVKSRLTELASDDLEDPKVVAAAGSRLEAAG